LIHDQHVPFYVLALLESFHCYNTILESMCSYFTSDTYANGHSACAAKLAAGLCADLASLILSGRVRNGFALVLSDDLIDFFFHLTFFCAWCTMMAPGNYLLICFAFHRYMILTMLCVPVYRRTGETSWASCWGKTSHGLLSSQQCSSGCISCTKSKMPQIYLNLDVFVN
jgi:hypothetical protein